MGRDGSRENTDESGRCLHGASSGRGPYVSNYWDQLAHEFRSSGREETWRKYLKEVHRRLLDRWRDNSEGGLTLKTDLYDEAISDHALLPLLNNGKTPTIGVDISFQTALEAKRRLHGQGEERYRIAVSDARNQAFKSESFDQVLSNSTLDHFPSRSELMASLQELHRVLKRNGTLILTLDNPKNPIVWLRNHLPYRLLKRFKIVPYYMGFTLSLPQLVRTLELSGFQVLRSTIIVHSPRILAIWAGFLLDSFQAERLKKGFQKLLKSLEYLECLPTRNFTGYFIAVKARKI